MQPDPVAGQFNRRDFLGHSFRFTLAGGAALGLAGSLSLLSGCSREPAVAQGFRVLRAQDVTLLSRLLPAILDGALPDAGKARADAVDWTVHSFDQLLADTSNTGRTVFLQVLDLLDLGIARGPVFGLWKPWAEASEADGAAVIERLSASGIGLLRGVYNGLCAMATMAWYLEPAHQGVTGYPGPPRKVIA